MHSMLRTLFRSYLDSDMATDPAMRLAEGLSTAGYVDEGWALRRAAQRECGPCLVRSEGWGERVVHVGPRLPDTTTIGELWFDTAEASLMILLPGYVDPESRGRLAPEAQARADRERNWFSLRPVQRWQYGAFLDLALVESSFRESTLRQLDAVDELAPMTGVSCGEAGLYLDWFGKSFAHDGGWLSLAECFGQAPWSDPAREWLGESHFNDSYCVAISPATLLIDPQETEGDSDPRRRMLYDPLDRPVDVTFRSEVRLAWGLRAHTSPTDVGPAGRLLRSLPRSVAGD